MLAIAARHHNKVFYCERSHRCQAVVVHLDSVGSVEPHWYDRSHRCQAVVMHLDSVASVEPHWYDEPVAWASEPVRG